MAYFNSDFISFTAAGLQIASFTDILSALTQKYKDVYGSDIDLSTGSTDGVFVNELALIINNICQTCANAYGNLDVNSANGRYLDALCALSNVFRKQPTRSSVSIDILNASNSSITMDNPIFLDQNNVEWEYQGSITIAAGATMNIPVVCKDVGTVSAPAGWITKTIDVNGIVVTQTDPANIGQNAETDNELRARRAQSSGANGTTTLDSLIGALLQLSGILDVKIFNNNSAGAHLINGDNTDVPAHQIYICIRKAPNITIEDSTIGEIIHQKLTPGVLTTPKDPGSYGVGKSYQFIDNLYGRQILESTETVYWKEALGIHHTITITLDHLYMFNEQTAYKIADNVIDYVNGLGIGETIYQQAYQTEIKQIVFNTDPRYRGYRTFDIPVYGINVPSSINPWAYYDYSTKTVTAIHEDGDPDKPIIEYEITIE